MTNGIALVSVMALFTLGVPNEKNPTPLGLSLAMVGVMLSVVIWQLHEIIEYIRELKKQK